jgi:hypothetical protein
VYVAVGRVALVVHHCGKKRILLPCAQRADRKDKKRLLIVIAGLESLEYVTCPCRVFPSHDYPLYVQFSYHPSAERVLEATGHHTVCDVLL